jgi:formylglycine-generating enzyme required for sulfatase activity
MRLRGENPSYLQRAQVNRDTSNDPVESILWKDAVETLGFAGMGLPTEAEWEYAARAGTNTPWWTGSDPDSLVGAENFADEADGYVQNAPVGLFRANPFGLHDVHGNVLELCRDRYDTEYYKKRVRWNPLNDPTGADDFVARGGSSGLTAEYAGSALRVRITKNYVHQSLGVRPARKLEP